MAEKTDKKAHVLSQERIRIKLRSYDHRMLDTSVSRIVETAQKTGAIVAGPVLLPVRIKKYTVLRSPHTDKKSREQFEMRIHKRLIDLKSPTSKTVDELMKLDLPAGVDVAIKSN
ncbi:30S ribosomal protein S10 [Candidatus Avelusimicrobium aviculae]|uniref:30S ribosomal protein S10 n=1 Tax=Candidatus Avelusimicrobium aviculae TaxID=3416206 RepID=UPI003D0B6005